MPLNRGRSRLLDKSDVSRRGMRQDISSPKSALRVLGYLGVFWGALFWRERASGKPFSALTFLASLPCTHVYSLKLKAHVGGQYLGHIDHEDTWK